MEILRHSQISVTMNTYSHVSAALQREAATAWKLPSSVSPKAAGYILGYTQQAAKQSPG